MVVYFLMAVRKEVTVYLSCHEAARVLDVHYTTVVRWCQRYKVKYRLVPMKIPCDTKTVAMKVKFIPFKILLNALAEHKRIPFNSVESENAPIKTANGNRL